MIKKCFICYGCNCTEPNLTILIQAKFSLKTVTMWPEEWSNPARYNPLLMIYNKILKTHFIVLSNEDTRDNVTFPDKVSKV